MSENFQLALALASEELLDIIYSRYEDECKTNAPIELSTEQTSDLAQRILALPDDDIAMLVFYYSFSLTYDEIAELLEQDAIKGKLRYVEQLLSTGMGFTENERIGKESLQRACGIALDEYIKVGSPVVRPKYSIKFRNKMRELKVVRGRPKHIDVLQKVAIVFVVLGVCFGAVLSANAQLRERVNRWITQTFPQFSEFRLEAAPAGIEVNFEELILFRPTFIPEWYALESIFELYPSVYLDYINDNEDRLTIIGHLPGVARISMSTEDADIESLIFNGEEAFFWERNGVFFLVFVLDGYHFNIIGRHDRDVLIQIAEGIEIP